MRIVLLISLTLSLLGCDKIRLEIDSNEVEIESEEGSWIFAPDSTEAMQGLVYTGWLLNEKTGELDFCTATMTIESENANNCKRIHNASDPQDPLGLFQSRIEGGGAQPNGVKKKARFVRFRKDKQNKDETEDVPYKYNDLVPVP